MFRGPEKSNLGHDLKTAPSIFHLKKLIKDKGKSFFSNGNAEKHFCIDAWFQQRVKEHKDKERRIVSFVHHGRKKEKKE